MSSPRSEGSVYISSIALSVREELGRNVDHIIFQTETGTFAKEIQVQVSPDHEHEEVFDPPIELSTNDRLSVSVQYPSRWKGSHTLSVSIEPSEIMTNAQVDTQGKQISLFKLHKYIEVAIDISRHSTDSESVPLPPTADEILSICPRFRLLIIGNSGVGKSTLIQKVFGVQDVDISGDSRGHADINREFIAADNGLVVLHDSVGLEAGEGNSLAKVKNFIDNRRKQKHVKDRLHAVWVCLTVPYAKGRLLEAGVEEFLRDREKILGDVPIVVVLTKVDLLDGKLLQTLLDEGVQFKSVEEAQIHLQPRRDQFLEQYCAKPLVRAAGQRNIPRVAVSTRSGFKLEPTISDLVRTTTSEMERYIKADPAYAAAASRSSIERDAPLYIAGMAQRASVETKVDLTIALGKKRYWKNLGASSRFSEVKVKEYLLVIHEDIIQVWNFHDPEMALQGDSFKAALLETSNLGVHDIQATPGSVVPLVTALGGLITDLIGVTIALPIAAGVVIAKLCSEIYRSSPTIVKRFMAYITDLIYVMKILFILAPQGTVTSQDVALALEVYMRSTYRNRIHLEIKDFSANFATLPGGRDLVLDKVEVLIRRYSITDEEVSHVRDQIQAAQGSS